MLDYQDPSGIVATVAPHVQGLMCTLLLPPNHYLFRYDGDDWPVGLQGTMNLRECFPTPIRLHFWDRNLRAIGFVPQSSNIEDVLRNLHTMIDVLTSQAYQMIFERLYEGR